MYQYLACKGFSLARALHSWSTSMKTILLPVLAACSLVALTACSCDRDREHYSDTTMDSASVDSKDMHPRHHHHYEDQER